MTKKKPKHRSIPLSTRSLYAGILVAILVILVLLVGLPLWRTSSGAWAACPRLGQLGPAAPSPALPVPALIGDQQAHQLYLSGSTIERAVVAPNGVHVAVATTEFVTVWDIREGTPSFDRETRRQTSAGIAWSPDGEYLAAAGSRDGLFGQSVIITVWHVPSQRNIFQARISGPLHDLQFSPDGDLLVASSGNRLVIWNALSGNRLCRPGRFAAGRDLIYFNWLNDTPTLLLQEQLGDGDRMSIWDATTGQQSWVLERRDQTHRVVTWSLGGNLIALWAGAGQASTSFEVLDATSGKTVFSAEGNWPLAWSPDSRYAAIGAGDGAIALLDTGDGAVLFTIPSQGSDLHVLSWSSNGRYITAIYDDDSFFVWQVLP